ncbi:MAG: DUF5009 domain-containing protein [Planctomycetaceae bacterium]|nr:DUF5009 domain-containing protein [Planctomycetaceae bacterium]
MADTYSLKRTAPEDSAVAAKAPAKAEGAATTGGRIPGRLVSLDAYRGFIMTMLAANGFGIAQLARLNSDNEVWQTFSYDTFQRLQFHFEHPPWESITGWCGVSFWDLIQPAFMFMVGVAMPFSSARRMAMGSGDLRRNLHALWRAVILTLMGVFLYSMRASQTNWVFTNVLAQIGLGYFVAWLLLQRSQQTQIAAFVAILVGYWGWFVMSPPPDGFDYTSVDASADNGEVYAGRFAAWSKNANAGHFFDVWLLNVLRDPKPDAASENSTPTDSASASDTADGAGTDNAAPADNRGLLRRWLFSSPERYTHNAGGYVTLNFIPSIATTLLGIFCGQLLIASVSSRKTLMTLLLLAAGSLLLGVAAHHTVCPIVKRIWTPSWVLFSGGYVIGMLALFYLLFDMLPLKRTAFPLVVVGMNSIAMYMMGQLLRPWVGKHIVETHFGGLITAILGEHALDTHHIGAVVLPTSVFAVFWLTAYWMYRNRYIVRV